MADLISREALFKKALEEKRFVFQYEDLLNDALVVRTVYGDFAEFVNSIPAVDAVPISDVYRLIAGHSNYHGDNILAALTCVAEGKEVKPIRPIDPAVDAVVLPCNVGDEIYRIVKPSGACKPFIPTLPDKVEPFGICYRNVMGGYSLIPLDEFGKTVFLTREEAEAALERREENAADEKT